MSDQHTREIKLQPGIRALAYSQKMVPELKISGVWLLERGFKAGGKVEITISENQLIIKPL